MIFAFISLIFNKISGIKIDQVTIFRNSVVVNQLVMNKPLDQMRSTGVNAPNRTSKLVNKSEFNGSILNRLMNFARSVPDFRRSDKGNIRHRLADIIILMILARECGCVGRADIIEFGRLHLNNASSG